MKMKMKMKMKPNRHHSLLGGLAGATAILLALTVPANAAIASYFIGVDGQATLPSGTYTGLANPNSQRLTLLYAHYDLNNPLYPHHYHSKGRLVYTGPNLGVNTAVTVSTSNFLPEASGGTHLFLATRNSGAYAGKSAIVENPNNHFTLLGMLDTGKLDLNVALENTLFNSSTGRWTGAITGSDVHMVLTFATAGLNFGSTSDPNAALFSANDGQHLSDDIDFQWVPWVDSATADGTEFIARFKLVDETGTFGDSGDFEYRFMAVPEPSSALLAGLGALFLLRRKR